MDPVKVAAVQAAPVLLDRDLGARATTVKFLIRDRGGQFTSSFDAVFTATGDTSFTPTGDTSPAPGCGTLRLVPDKLTTQRDKE